MDKAQRGTGSLRRPDCQYLVVGIDQTGFGEAPLGELGGSKVTTAIAIAIVIGAKIASGRLHRAAAEATAWAKTRGHLRAEVVDLSGTVLDLTD